MLLLFAAFFALRRILGVGFEPQSLRDAVERMGLWAPLIFVGIVAFSHSAAGAVVLGAECWWRDLRPRCRNAVTVRWAAADGPCGFCERTLSGSDASLARCRKGTRAGCKWLACAWVPSSSDWPPLTRSPPPSALCERSAGIDRACHPLASLAAALGCLGRAGLYAYLGNATASGELDGVLKAVRRGRSGGIAVARHPRIPHPAASGRDAAAKKLAAVETPA